MNLFTRNFTQAFVILALVLAFLLYMARQKTSSTLNRITSLLEAMNMPGMSSGITELKNKDDFLDINPECVETPEFYGGVKSKVCILPGETYSEGHLRSKGVFDGDTVNTIVRAMTVYPDATLLDCGANIGMVTTVVAAMGRQVVSVDPMKEHLSYLHRALELLGNEGNVRLLNNAVSNESGLLYPYTKNPNNWAAIKMYTEEEIKKNNFIPTGPPVKVVTVMDILATITTPTVILKVDVESFECRAVSREVAQQKKVLIPFIIMEWTMLQVMPEYTACVDWLLGSGYKPHHWQSFKEYTREQVLELKPWWQGAPQVHDLVWLHNSADPNKILNP